MKYYQQPIEKIFDALSTSKDGLSHQEAQQRLEKHGRNEIKAETRINKLKLFFAQFKSFIIYIMLFAVVLSVILQEYPDAIVIALILIANALIGYYQELSAHQSLNALMELSSSINAKVKRDGKKQETDAKELVPGDIIFLEAGDKIPADARIITATELKVEESSLTGESVGVEKHAGEIDQEVQLGDQKNMLFSSTSVQGGTATAVVVRTGMETEIGRITEMVQTAEQQLTPLQRRLEKFGKKLGVFVIGICVVVLLVMGIKEYLANGFSWNILLDALLVAVALAVAAVPSGLPAVVTIALSIGVKKLLAQKALVRKLASVETLGSCNVICSDKTGTLTQNQMTVQKAWTLAGEAEVEGIGYQPEGEIKGSVNILLFETGKYCNDASVDEKEGEWVASGDPTEAAVLVAALKAGIENEVERVDEIPFSSERKRMSVLVRKESKLYVYTKGAPDQILEVCTHVLQEEEKEELTDELKNKIKEQINSYSQQALRVLAFAYKEVENKEAFDEENLTFVGLQAMIDPPREEVIGSIKTAHEAGIRILMITGDYKETAKAIGENVGITGEVLTGYELGNMEDEKLEKHLQNSTNLFARVVPEHKQRIITHLQKQGKVVAMTGDGVNDAPALKKADIGVAVGSGTDVAKEASDFVLMDDSFTNIVNAVREGRGIYDNIQKAIMHLLSGNMSEVLIIFLAVLFGWNLPLTAIMLLWVNLVSDGAPALALAVDPYGDDIMKRKPKEGSENILPKPELIFTGGLAVLSTIFALTLFWWAGGNADEQKVLAQTTVFTFLVLSEFVLLMAVRSYFGVRLFTNLWVWTAMAGSIVLQAILLYVPFFRDVFSLEVLSLRELGSIGVAIAALIITSFTFKTVLVKIFKK